MQEFINDLILQAGEIAKNAYDKEHIVEKKKPRELVTETDKEIEQFIKNIIMQKYPEHQIIGEESDIVNAENVSHIWYIDPIDGTTNFAHNIPLFGISIGYEFEGETRDAAIYLPILGELYYATRGKGAFKNNKRIFVSKRAKLLDIVGTTGFACIRTGKRDNNLKYFSRIVPRLRSIRRMGAATLDMCYVACARFDAFWEMRLNPWDMVAGILIVKEAGGRVTDFSGGSDMIEKQEILATNGTIIHKQILELLRP